MNRLWILGFLPVLIMSLGRCQSADRLRTARNANCQAIPPIPEYKPADPAALYNSWLRHAAAVSDCARLMRCSERLAEWERDCAESDRDAVRASWVPGALIPYLGCRIPRPKCD